MVLVAIVIGAACLAMRSSVHDMVPFGSFKSYTDEFHLTVLETKSAPSSFEERVRVRCEKDMEVGIEVVDLKETGVHEVHGKNGEIFYRVGNPYKAGESGPVHADGKSSTCEILFKVSTTPSNTTWHSVISTTTTNAFSHGEDANGVDTTLPISMVISQVQTNWQDSYQRGSWIPLATLGDYKIMLTIK